MSRVYSSQSLTWDGDVLRLNSREVARVEPDITYPAMWRVRLPNGSVFGYGEPHPREGCGPVPSPGDPKS
jgi:hypothetical protein